MLWAEPGSQVGGSACSEWAWSAPSGLWDWSVSGAVRTNEIKLSSCSAANQLLCNRPRVKLHPLTSSFFLGSDSGFLNSGESPYGE